MMRIAGRSAWTEALRDQNRSDVASFFPENDATIGCIDRKPKGGSMYRSAFKQFCNGICFRALAVICLFVFGMAFVPTNAAADASQAYTLTIWRFSNPEVVLTDHPLTEQGDAAGEVAGAVFRVWKVSDDFTTSPTAAQLKYYNEMEETALIRVQQTLTGLQKIEMPVETKPTGDDGRTTIAAFSDGSPFTPGIYYVREKTWEEGTQAVPFLIQLPLGNDNVVEVYPKEVWKPGELLLHKVDSAGKALSGVEFELMRVSGAGEEIKVPLNDAWEYDEEKGKPRILVTDAAGEIRVSKLPVGDYRFRETKALEGYEILENPVDMTVQRARTAEVTVKNRKKPETGGYRFMKIDSATRQALSGAVFDVYRVTEGNFNDRLEPVERNGVPYTVTSGENGIFEVRDLPYGKYALKEQRAPSGYLRSEKTIGFEVTVRSLSDSSGAAVIENVPENPGLPSPKTGDNRSVRVLIGVGAAAVLLLAGTWIFRKKRK